MPSALITDPGERDRTGWRIHTRMFWNRSRLPSIAAELANMVLAPGPAPRQSARPRTRPAQVTPNDSSYRRLTYASIKASSCTRALGGGLYSPSRFRRSPAERADRSARLQQHSEVMVDREVDRPCDTVNDDRKNPCKSQPPSPVSPLRWDQRPPETSLRCDYGPPIRTIPKPLSI